MNRSTMLVEGVALAAWFSGERLALADELPSFEQPMRQSVAMRETMRVRIFIKRVVG